MNYDIWRELFEIHCIGYGIDDHLQPPIGKQPENSVTEWNRIDAIIKSWLYGTLETSLLHLIFKKKATAYEIWQSLEKVFRTKKANKVIQLDNELRNITIGTSNVTDYCNRIKTLADLLDNMEAKVPEPNLVAYTLNGLSSKFRMFATSIRHRDPLPSFWEIRSMLIQEEQQLLQEERRQSSLSNADTASSPHALFSESSNHQPQNNRGGYRGGCGGRGRNRGGRNGRRNTHNGSGGYFQGQQQRGTNPHGTWAFGWYPVPAPAGGSNPNGLLPSPQPQPHGPRQNAPQPQLHQFFGPQQAFHTTQIAEPFPWPNNNNSAAPESTSLPQMFSTMSLNDPGQDGWFMDTGATSHVHANAGSPHQTNSHAM